MRELYADLGARQKVFVDLACSSHYAMWEKNHVQLFRASLEWLTQGSVDGKQQAMLRLGYPSTEAPVSEDLKPRFQTAAYRFHSFPA